VAALLMAFLAAVHAQSSPVKDTLEQRLAACAGCHGARGEGLKAAEYYPRIAGKPAGYLYNQLLNFRERRRHSPAMNYMVALLADEYLREIAGYYSKLPSSAPIPRERSSAELMSRGEALMLRGDAVRKIPACAACHDKALGGMEPAIPGLLGLEAQYIGAQMTACRRSRTS
jgi:cytochrome c553